MADILTTSEEREQAFILLFEKSFNDELDCEKILELAAETETIVDSRYTTRLFTETCNKIPVIDEFIKKYSKGWSFDRISKVALALLRLAICEIRYMDKVPTGVAINEAVNLCKKYASEDEYSFVNGVLGSFAKGEE